VSTCEQGGLVEGRLGGPHSREAAPGQHHCAAGQQRGQQQLLKRQRHDRVLQLDTLELQRGPHACAQQSIMYIQWLSMPELCTHAVRLMMGYLPSALASTWL
jgi:hypothetical protein